jgi:photosystem II stability/assembly factor-like uncharacterized protein
MTSALITTHDGGHTWTPLPDPCTANPFDDRLAALDADHVAIICGGEPSAGQQLKSFAVSSDGGRHWVSGSADSSGYVDSLSFGGPSTIWLALDRGTLYRTSRNGRDWREAVPLSTLNPGDGEVGPVQFVDRRHGWVAASNNSMVRTTDGGKSWHSVVVD